MSTKDQRRPDSVGPMLPAKRALHFTFWTSDNLLWPLGLLFKDLHDLTDTAHALRLWQELMAYQTRLPGHLPNLWMGIVNQPVAASSGPAENETVVETTWTVIKGSPFSESLRFCPLGEVTWINKRSSQLPIFEKLLLPAVVTFLCSCLDPRS